MYLALLYAADYTNQEVMGDDGIENRYQFSVNWYSGLLSPPDNNRHHLLVELVVRNSVHSVVLELSLHIHAVADDYPQEPLRSFYFLGPNHFGGLQPASRSAPDT